MRFRSELDQIARQMQELEDVTDVRHEERLLHPRMLEWRMDGIIPALKQAYKTVHDLRCLPPKLGTYNRRVKALQAGICKMLTDRDEGRANVQAMAIVAKRLAHL